MRDRVHVGAVVSWGAYCLDGGPRYYAYTLGGRTAVLGRPVWVRSTREGDRHGGYTLPGDAISTAQYEASWPSTAAACVVCVSGPVQPIDTHDRAYYGVLAVVVHVVAKSVVCVAGEPDSIPGGDTIRDDLTELYRPLPTPDPIDLHRTHDDAGLPPYDGSDATGHRAAAVPAGTAA